MKGTKGDHSVLVEEAAEGDLPSKSRPNLPPPSSDLKSVIEVTEENEAHEKGRAFQEPQPRVGCLERFARLLDGAWGRIFAGRSMQMEITNTDILAAIAQVKEEQYKAPVFLPAQRERRKVLVLDLDETLIHTTFNRPRKYDFESEVIFNGRETTIYTTKRFGLDNFLFEMAKLYEVVVYTASQRVYADKVIDLIDRKRRISHRLYREHCICINKTHYLKNIKSLGRSPEDVVIVDDNSMAGLLQPDNFYKIDLFDGSPKDRQLCRLASFLRHLATKKAVGSVRSERVDFESIEIPVKEEDSALRTAPPRSVVERRKQYRHSKRNSEIDSLVSRSEEDKDEAETTASELVKRL